MHRVAPRVPTHSMKNSDKDFKIRVFLTTLHTFWSHWRTGTFDWVVGTVGVVRTRVLQRQLAFKITSDLLGARAGKKMKYPTLPYPTLPYY